MRPIYADQPLYERVCGIMEQVHGVPAYEASNIGAYGGKVVACFQEDELPRGPDFGGKSVGGSEKRIVSHRLTSFIDKCDLGAVRREGVANAGVDAPDHHTPPPTRTALAGQSSSRSEMLLVSQPFGSSPK